MSTSNVLSPRALQELLKGNYNNFVSVKIEVEVVHRVHRTVAMRFSPVWKRALQDPSNTIVTVTLPPAFPPSPQVTQQARTSEKSRTTPPPAPPSSPESEKPASPESPRTTPKVPSPPPSPHGRLALKFIVQWMEKGGGDAKGINAVPYPTHRPGLETLLALAAQLEIKELRSRLQQDLDSLVVPKHRPVHCPRCKRLDHPGIACLACYYCHDPSHLRCECPHAQQAFLERERRRQERAALEEDRRIWEEALSKRREETEKRILNRQIRTGQVAVGDGDKMIYRWL